MADSNLDIIDDPNAPKKDQGQAPGQAPVGVASTGPQAPGGATGSGTSGPQQASTAKTGSGFSNIQNVLNANKQGGQNLGNVVGSGITNAATDVGQQLGQAQSTFGQQSAAGTVGNEADKANRDAILGRISGYGSNPDNSVNAGGTSSFNEATGQTTSPSTTVNNVGAGPGVSAAPTTLPGLPIGQSDIDAFSKYRAGAYTGPQQLGNYDQLSQQAQQAQQLGQNVSSSGGQQSLLQQFVGQGQKQYGTGAQSLDQLLLGQGAGNQLQQAKQATLGLGSKVQGAEQGAEAQAAQAAALSKQFGADTAAALTAAQDPIQAQLKEAQTAAQTADTGTQTNYKTLQDILSKTSPTATPGSVSTMPISNVQNAIPELLKQGLITQEQATQMGDLLSKGIQQVDYDDPNSYASRSYNEIAALDPTGNAGMLGTNADLIDLMNRSKYQTLNSIGVDPNKLLNDELLNTQGNANATSLGSFANPTQAAKLNALSQLSGQTVNPLNVSGPAYAAGKNTFNFGDFLSKINAARALHPVVQFDPHEHNNSGPGGLGLNLHPDITSPLPQLGPMTDITKRVTGSAVDDVTNQAHRPVTLAHGGMVPNIDGSKPKFNKLKSSMKKK